MNKFSKFKEMILINKTKTKTKTIDFLKTNNKFIPFFISFIIFMIYCIIKNNIDFPYDSGVYWDLSSKFYSNKEFSFTKFYPETIRGYFLPLLLFVSQKIGLIIFNNSFVGLWLLNSMLFSLMIAILLEMFLKKKSMSIKKTIISSVVYSLLIIVFYGWTLIYPMSDNFAIILFIIALFFSVKKFDNNIVNNIKYIFVGCFLYASYNTRPAYLTSIIIFIFIWMIFNFKTKFKFALNILLIFLGGLILALPQMIINSTYLHIYSPMIIFSYAGSKSLNLAQLYWGIGINSYQTSIAPLHNYPSAGVFSINKTGEIIRSIENITVDNISYLAIIKLMFKYPFEMIGIYFSHFTNMLFVLDIDCYVKDMSRKLNLIFLLNGTVIYLTGFFIFILKIQNDLPEKIKTNFLYKLKDIDEKYIYFSCPVITALLIVPGAVESRFFIYVHIIIYFIVCFVIEYTKLFEIFKRHYIKITASFLLFIGVFSSLLSYNLASKSPEGITFSLNPYAINIEREINNQINQNLTPYISKGEVYKNGYVPPEFSFITKADKDGEISFSITFDKDIPVSHNLSIFINGENKKVTSEIKKGTYNFKFTVEPNKINTIKVQSSFSYNNELGKKESFTISNLKVK